MPRGGSRWHAAALAVAALGLAGCPRYGVIDDGTSISWGPANGGKLINPQRLPRKGDGFYIPPRWAQRGNNWGTDEMMSLITYAGRRIAAAYPGAELAVADISPRRGGRTRWHASHQTGRDVDLVYFVTDDRGKPVQWNDMRKMDENGVTRPGVDPATGQQLPTYHFDVQRNWALVRAVLENPAADVQYIFVADWLKQKMIDYALSIGEPKDVVDTATYILHQPIGAAAHDDHFHVRIYCSASDAQEGCEDYGRMWWTRRDRKYIEHARRSLVATLPIPGAQLSQMPAMLSLSSLPFRGFVPRQ